MKIRIFMSVFCVLMVVFSFLYQQRSKHELREEDRYEMTIRDIINKLLSIRAICVSNNTEQAKSSRFPDKISFSEAGFQTSLTDQWGKQMLMSVQSNGYSRITSAGSDSTFYSDDDIVGTLTFTNDIEINVRGKYKDSIFKSSIFSSSCE